MSIISPVYPCYFISIQFKTKHCIMGFFAKICEAKKSEEKRSQIIGWWVTWTLISEPKHEGLRISGIPIIPYDPSVPKMALLVSGMFSSSVYRQCVQAAIEHRWTSRVSPRLFITEQKLRQSNHFLLIIALSYYLSFGSQDRSFFWWAFNLIQMQRTSSTVTQ